MAVDPGEECGVFWTDGLKHGWIELPAYHAILVVETQFLNDTWRAEDLVLVVERWDTTAGAAKMSRQHDALETIGALRYLARKHSVEFILQARADRLRVTNEMLNIVGWNVTTPKGHAREAARHALIQYVVRYSQHPAVRRLVGMMNGEENGENDGANRTTNEPGRDVLPPTLSTS